VCKFILASQSPRRVDLLTEAGYAFAAIPAIVDEAHDPELSPPELTCANAKLKALTVSHQHPKATVLGADTLVYVDGEPLGKPVDMTEAVAMLQRLVGRSHQVCTGVALCRQAPALEVRFHVITNVTFHPLTKQEIKSYLAKINPLDKAGGYAAQDHGSDIIANIKGSWTNVVGLPMEALTQELNSLNIVGTI
jgi:septum formation protein